MSDVLHGVAGLAGLFGIAWLLSEQRRAVPWRLVGAGVLLALLLAVAMLKLPPVATALGYANHALDALER
ncbi:MAG: Na+ dependent nucleoside transporter N-terminal domain-containing protein, partial [Betaproteobacteria bacterium]